jgi:hypothetical protein
MLRDWDMVLPVAVMFGCRCLMVLRRQLDRALAVAKDKLDAIRSEDGHPARGHGSARQEDQAEQCGEQIARAEMIPPRAHGRPLAA